jgi:anthranilate synthase component 1
MAFYGYFPDKESLLRHLWVDVLGEQFAELLMVGEGRASSLDVLRAAFPAGTLSGAPKIRAMEIIDELEPVKRGIYGGACGYLSFAGDMDLAIAIRTGIIKNGTLYVQAAAGVVADSIPEMEWRETEHKARALLRAAELVEGGF